MKLPFLLICITLFSCRALAQNWHDTKKSIDSLFSKYTSSKPGGQLAISKHGKLIYSNAWGLSDIENDIQFTTTTLTEAGSISKQFVAAAVLILQQQGKLSLSDDVRLYIPELPDYHHKITIEHLIHHTSGIREWSSLAALSGWPRTTKAYRNSDVLDFICMQKQLNNIPGTEFIYSNSNYILLTEIVERISGKSLDEFTRAHIFLPAGMKKTLWRDNYRKVVKDRAIAYSGRDSTYLLDMPNESVYGPGGLLTTSEDLLKWNDFFLSGKLGGDELLKKQLEIVDINTGAISNYGAGLFIEKVRGQKKIYHTGQTAGYTGVLESFPDIGLSIAWLSNTTENKNNLFEEIEEIEKLLTPTNEEKVLPKEEFRDSKLGADNSKCGWYRHEKTNEGFHITEKNDSLFLQGSPLRPTGSNSFRYLASKVKFINSDQFELTTPDKRKVLFTRVKKGRDNKPNEVTLGTYNIEELNSTFEISRKGDKLYLSTGYINVPLEETFKGGYNFSIFIDSGLFPDSYNLYFESAEYSAGEISSNSSRKIKFRKILGDLR